MNKWIIRVVCFYFWKCYFLNTQCNFFYINMSSLVINSFKNEINTIILKILRCVGSTSFSHSPLDALLWWYTVLCVSNLSRGGPNLWRASHINITGAYGRTSAVPYSIIYPAASTAPPRHPNYTIRVLVYERYSTPSLQQDFFRRLS